MSKVKMISQSPSGKNRVTWLPREIAWAAARGVSMETHCAVILYGEFGTARFAQDGSGNVEWNEKSLSPGDVSRFCDRTTVMI